MKFTSIKMLVLLAVSASLISCAFVSSSASASDGLSVKSRYMLARRANKHDPNETIDSMTQEAKSIISAEPKAGDAYAMLGAAQYMGKDYKGALQTCQKAIALKPTIPFYARSARNYGYHASIKLEDWQTAYKLAAACLVVEPQAAVAHDLAMICQRLGDKAHEKEYAAKAVQLEHESIAEVKDMKDISDSQKIPDVFKKVNARLAADPKNRADLLIREQCYFRTNDLAKALVDMNNLIALDPTIAVNYIFRAQLYLNMGNKGKVPADIQMAKNLGFPNAENIFAGMTTQKPDAKPKR